MSFWRLLCILSFYFGCRNDILKRSSAFSAMTGDALLNVSHFRLGRNGFSLYRLWTINFVFFVLVSRCPTALTTSENENDEVPDGQRRAEVDPKALIDEQSNRLANQIDAASSEAKKLLNDSNTTTHQSKKDEVGNSDQGESIDGSKIELGDQQKIDCENEIDGSEDEEQFRERYTKTEVDEKGKPKCNSDQKIYKKKSITNRDDNKIRQLLDKADGFLDDEKHDEALAMFDQLLKTYPQSPRAHFGRARALESLAAAKKSNSHLESCIKEYLEILYLPNVPDDLAKESGKRLVDRARFRGWLNKAAQGQRRLLEIFPGDLILQNDLGVTLLMMGRNEDAKKLFYEVLSKDSENGLALVHYGFILKTIDNNLNDGVEYLRRGIDTQIDGTQDGRFYFHLGDALQRLDRSAEAYDWYDRAAKRGIFLSKMQRSLYNVAGLTARPFWSLEQTSYQKQLQAIEKEWQTIRDEGLALVDVKEGVFKSEDEKLTNAGDWKQFTLYMRGKPVEANCERAPKTCAIVAKFHEAVGCTRGQIKFSVMTSGTRVWPHCGPTNCRLRGHLGLVVPAEPRIRVGDETRSWRKGKFLVLDDSFEHEVRHDGEDLRLILIVDFWHPELTYRQRATLPPI